MDHPTKRVFSGYTYGLWAPFVSNEAFVLILQGTRLNPAGGPVLLASHLISMEEAR